MATFKSLPDAHTIASRYDGRLPVYLESKEDAQVFAERWFNGSRDTLRFIAADQVGTGGCQGVIQQVAQDRDAGLAAYGIVDRDVLLGISCPDLFFFPEENTPHIPWPLPPEIIVLDCWEMENYLLDSEAVETFQADEQGRSKWDSGVVLETLSDFAQNLLGLMAANLVLMTYRKESLSPLFEAAVLEPSREKLTSHLSTKISIPDINTEGLFDQYAELIGETVPTTSADFHNNWEQLRCRVDGKMFLTRFFHKPGHKNNLPRFHLATRIKEQNRVSPELTRHIERLVDIANGRSPASPQISPHQSP
ncbi:MAG: DUF4435 domain-containing protein [Magnetococcales bacterium]|nr:DUF4435 domain-containing protein [Magnetococcales bacterium]